MNKHLKNICIFTGGLAAGAVIGGTSMIVAVAKSKTLRTAIADAIYKCIFEEFQSRPYVYATNRHVRNYEWYFDTRESAETFLEKAQEVIDLSVYITIGEVATLLNLPGNVHDDSRGWTKIPSMVYKVGDNWLVRFPEPIDVSQYMKGE